MRADWDAIARTRNLEQGDLLASAEQVEIR